MARKHVQPGFFDLEERYARLSEAGNPLEALDAAIDWELFRKPLDTSENALNMAKRAGWSVCVVVFADFCVSSAPLLGPMAEFLSPLSLTQAHFACLASASASCCKPCWSG